MPCAHRLYTPCPHSLPYFLSYFRPANASMANNITGLYQAVPAADSLLINGRGRFDDCSSNISLATRGDNGVLSSFCAPQLNPVVGPDADRVTGGE